MGDTWVLARCEALGLEVNLGGLHDYRPGRPSLVCDVMEPLRVPAVDRWVVTLCNQRICSPEDFQENEGGVRLQPERFPGILHHWEQHWFDQQQEAKLDSWLEELTCWLR